MSVLEGVNLFAYGHSYVAADFFGQSSQSRYVNRVARRLGMNVVNRATAGWMMQDAAIDAIGTRRPWAVNTRGVVLLDAVTNNVRLYGASAVDLLGFEHSLRAFCHFVSLSAKADDDSRSIARPGGYLFAGPDFSSGHNWRMRSGENVIATWSGSGSKFVVGLYGLGGGGGGQFDVLADGAVVQTVNTDAQTVALTRNRRTFTPIAVPVTLASGSHTIQVRRRGGFGVTGTGPFLDFVGVRSSAPPRIVLMKGVNLAAAGYAPPAAAGAGNAAFDAYNARIDKVAAEFTNVSVCDARAGWSPATMVGSDGVHPTARGNAQLADVLEQTLLAAVPDFTAGVTG